LAIATMSSNSDHGQIPPFQNRNSSFRSPLADPLPVAVPSPSRGVGEGDGDQYTYTPPSTFLSPLSILSSPTSNSRPSIGGNLPSRDDNNTPIHTLLGYMQRRLSDLVGSTPSVARSVGAGEGMSSLLEGNESGRQGEDSSGRDTEQRLRSYSKSRQMSFTMNESPLVSSGALHRAG